MALPIVGYHFYGDFKSKFYVDLRHRHVLRDEILLARQLTAKQFEVLCFFLQHANEVTERKDIQPLHDVVRELGRDPADNYLSQIRAKLGLRSKELFIPVRKIGYVLRATVRPEFSRDAELRGALLEASELHFNLHTVESMRTSIEQASKLIEQDGSLPGPYVTRAYEYINLSHVAFCAAVPDEVVPKARDDARRALVVSPRYGPAEGILGLISLIYDYDWHTALQQLSEALEHDPRDAATLLSYSHLMAVAGRFDESVAAVERAATAAPSDMIVQASVGWMRMFAGDKEGALSAGEFTANVLFPNFSPAHSILGWIREAAGDTEGARQSYERSLELETTPVVLASLGHLEATEGHRHLAQLALQALRDLHDAGKAAYVSGYCEALIYAGLGQIRLCMDALDKAYGQHADWLMHLQLDGRWDRLRSNPRFNRLATLIDMPFRT